MSRLNWALAWFAGFALVNTVLAFTNLVSSYAANSLNQTTSSSGNPFPPALQVVLPLVQFLSIHSFVLAPTGWLCVGGIWIWRGRLKSKWEGLGFDSGTFRLILRMRGGKTRIRLLSSLTKPKDRYQLAQELGMDWRAIDQHLVMLSRYSLVTDDVAYGKVRMYRLTQSGRLMLQVLEDLDSDTLWSSTPTPKTKI